MSIEKATSIGDATSLERATKLFMKATENDWRTVQSTAQRAIASHTAARLAAAEVEELMNVARSILLNENGDHLRRSGLGEK